MAILSRHLFGHTQSSAARNNRDFAQGVTVFHVIGSNGMSRFMVGNALLLIFTEDVLAFRAQYHSVTGIFKICRRNFVSIFPGSSQSGFIDEIFQVGP